MMTDRPTFDSIEQYLSNQLVDPEKNSFEERLRSDQEFAQLVSSHKAANAIILGNRLQQVKELMDADFNNGKVGNSNRRKWWWGGAFMLIAIGVSLWVLSNENSLRKSNVQSEKNTKAEGMKPTLQSAEKDTPVSSTLPGNFKEPASRKHFPEDRTMDTIAPSEKSFSLKETPTEHFPQNENKKEPIPVASPCKHVALHADATHEPACTGKSNGSIRVFEKSIKGGRSPYEFLLVTKRQDTIRQTEERFENLAAGSYALYIQDRNACYSPAIPVYVSEQNCSTSKAQSFNPSLGEVFNYPTLNEEATLAIYSAAGTKVHSVRLYSGTSGSWNGMDQNGQNLPAGLYIYILEYNSGAKETEEIILY